MRDTREAGGAAPPLRCSLCGAPLADTDACHAACPLARGCALVRCPNCGHEMPDPRRTRLAGALWRWLTRRRRKGHPPTRAAGYSATGAKTAAPLGRALPELRAGTRARITAVRAEISGRADQLSNLGVIPGTELRLIQRHPAVVVEVGETTLALDTEVARDILVRPLDVRRSTEQRPIAKALPASSST